MQVELDIFELSWLLETCLRGSHQRASTIRKFVDVWYDKLNEEQRYNLYEWSIRLTYNGSFKTSELCCGADRIFMKRYDPENQYMATTFYEGKEETYRTFLMDGKYHTGCNRFIAPEYITKVEKFVPKVERSIYEEQATERN